MSAPVHVGDVLAGKYEVERVLGQGGMGVVVAARHLMLGERVAIKFLLPQALTQPDVVTRFLREGQAANRIRSEHVARVYDVGRLEHGEPYLVMEFLDGSDLGSVLRTSGRLAVPLACEYVLQACEALAEAHALGIVHRDLKPANLFVTRRADGGPLIKIIDFGISKIVLRAEPGALIQGGDMTQTAVMMGSPLYMAPEQMMSAKSVDARSDIWSLGVILHQLLAGQLPFRGATVMEIYDRILEGAPPLRTLRPEVPERLEAAVLRCLRKNPDGRFADVGQLAAELAELAPAHARISADRIARVLQLPAAALAAADFPPPTPPRSSGRAAFGAAPTEPARGASSRPPAPAPSSPPPAAPAAQSGAPAQSGAAADAPQLVLTDRSWGGTRPPARSAHRAGLALRAGAALAGAAVLAFVVVWFAFGREAAPPAPEVAASSDVSAEVAPAPPPPTPVDTAPAPASAFAPASAPASASAPVSAPAPASAAAPPGRPRPPPPPVKPREKDLFSDPR